MLIFSVQKLEANQNILLTVYFKEISGDQFAAKKFEFVPTTQILVKFE